MRTAPSDMQVATTTVHAGAEIHPDRRVRDFLALSFTDAELRRELRDRFGAEIANQLPGERADLNAVIDHAVETLGHRGLIDADFFAWLIALRPHRRREIEALAAAYTSSLETHPPIKTAPVRASQRRQIVPALLGLGLVGAAVALATVLLKKTDPAAIDPLVQAHAAVDRASMPSAAPTAHDDAMIEVLDIEFKDGLLRLRIRNIGSRTALLKTAALELIEPAISGVENPASAHVIPVRYDWLITRADLSARRSSVDLNRRVDVDDLDILEFSLAHEQIQTALDTQAQLRIEYNKAQEVRTDPIRIRLDNLHGRFPQFDTPGDPAQLRALLGREDVPPYTLTQIVETATAQPEELMAPAIARHLDHEDASVRRASAHFFTKVHHSPVAEQLADLLEDSDPDVRREALGAVIRHGEEVAGSAQQRLLHASPTARESLVAALGHVEHALADTVLLAALDDRGIVAVIRGEERLVASTAIRALTAKRSLLLSGRLPRLLDDDNPGIKLAAIDAVMALGATQSTRDILVSLTSSSHEAIRRHAQDALGQLQQAPQAR